MQIPYFFKCLIKKISIVHEDVGSLNRIYAKQNIAFFHPHSVSKEKGVTLHFKTLLHLDINDT